MGKDHEIVVLSEDEDNAKIFFSDLMTSIGSNGQCLKDIVDGEPVPDEHDMLDVNEVVLLWAYLPEERRPELAPHIAHLRGSIKNPPSDFSGWKKVLNEAHYGSFELKLSILMMATLALSYREWLNISLKSEQCQVMLRRVAAAKLRELATTSLEIGVARRKYEEAFK